MVFLFLLAEFASPSIPRWPLIGLLASNPIRLDEYALPVHKCADKNADLVGVFVCMSEYRRNDGLSSVVSRAD
jgi:hypothetical protein